MKESIGATDRRAACATALAASAGASASTMAAVHADTHFVIARYDEPTDWLADLGEVRLTVYNKGPSLVQLPHVPAAEELRVPNRGREGETYLRHILDHYDKLAKVTVFSQARITDHLAAWVAYGDSTVWRGRRFATEAAFLHCLAGQAAATGLSQPTERVDASTDDANWRSDWNRNHLGIAGAWFMPDLYRAGHITFHDWFERFVGPYPRPEHPSGADAGLFCACSCGIFAVRRDRILSRPREYYAALWDQVSWHPNPVEGHFLERSWYYIFGGAVAAAGGDTDEVPAAAAPPCTETPPAHLSDAACRSSLAEQCPIPARLRAAPPVDPASPRVIFCAFGPCPPSHLESVVRVAAAQHRIILLADRASVRLAALPGVDFVDATRFRHSTRHLCAKYLAASPAPTPHEWAALERLFIAGRYLLETSPPLPTTGLCGDPPSLQSAAAALPPPSAPGAHSDCPSAHSGAATPPAPLSAAPSAPARPSQVALILDHCCVLLRPVSSVPLNADRPHASADLAAVFCDAAFCQRVEASFEAAGRIDAAWRRRTLCTMGAIDLRAPAPTEAPPAALSPRGGNGRDCTTTTASPADCNGALPAPPDPAAVQRPSSVFLLDGCCARHPRRTTASLHNSTRSLGEAEARSDPGALALDGTCTRGAPSALSRFDSTPSDVPVSSSVVSHAVESTGGYVCFTQRDGRNFALGAGGREIEPVCVLYTLPPALGENAGGGAVGEGRGGEEPGEGVELPASRAAEPPLLSLAWLRQRLALPPLLLDRSREVAMRSR